MKRSEVNRNLADAVGFLRGRQFALPPFALWSPEDWQEKKGEEFDDICRCGLGWDVTDFGGVQFEDLGLLQLTLRNGDKARQHGNQYAEKVLIVREGQTIPRHFHRKKTKDVINRGGGVLQFMVSHSDREERLSDRHVRVSADGRAFWVGADETIELQPGESITVPARRYHQLRGKPGCGMVIVGEVSTVNDDGPDDRFLETVERFPSIVEDEPPLYLLVRDYAALQRSPRD